MKKNILLILFSLFALVSCSEMDFTYIPENEDITFTKSSSSFSLDGEELVITLQRGALDKALDLDITLNDESGVFSLKNKSVSFATNQNTAEVVVTYNINNIQPVVEYSFELSFDEAKAGPAGIAAFTGKGMMPLEYEDYGEVTYSGYIQGLLATTTYKLQLAKMTSTYFKICDFLCSGVDLEFNVKDGLGYITSPEAVITKWYSSYPLIPIETGASHPTYGIVTANLDPDPQYFPTAGTENNKLVLNSEFTIDAFYTVSAGYFGWQTDYFIVTAVD